MGKYSDGTGKADVELRFAHFLESGIRPMACATIGEKGFKCSRMESGECTCKVPAAIRYIPMSLDELRDIIANLPVTDKVLDNMQTANGFMEECLYNQGNAIAETVINTELKDHFKFMVSSLKPLIARCKELSKAYQQVSAAAVADFMGLKLRQRMESRLNYRRLRSEKSKMPGALLWW